MARMCASLRTESFFEFQFSCAKRARYAASSYRVFANTPAPAISAAESACCARSRSVVCAASDTATNIPSTAVFRMRMDPPFEGGECKDDADLRFARRRLSVIGLSSSAFSDNARSAINRKPTTREAELPAEVCLLDPIAAEERFRIIRQHDTAGLHDVAAMGRHEGHVRVLFNEEDRRALGVDLFDDAEDCLDHLRR